MRVRNRGRQDETEGVSYSRALHRQGPVCRAGLWPKRLLPQEAEQRGRQRQGGRGDAAETERPLSNKRAASTSKRRQAGGASGMCKLHGSLALQTNLLARDTCCCCAA